MSDNLFQAPAKRSLKAKIALVGPSGTGKTYTALLLAHELLGIRPGDEAALTRIAVLDTEGESSDRYNHGLPFWFAVAKPKSFHPDNYTRAIEAAESAGFDVVIIDSLSHAWSGHGGALDLVGQNQRGGSNFSNWAKVNPIIKRMTDAMIRAKRHVIVTMRAKTEWVMDGNAPVKAMAGIDQRGGIEYEFDFVLTLDRSHRLTADKSRCPRIDARTFDPDTTELAGILREWLGQQSDGAVPVNSAPAAAPAKSDRAAVAHAHAALAGCSNLKAIKAWWAEVQQAVTDGQITPDGTAIASLRAKLGERIQMEVNRYTEAGRDPKAVLAFAEAVGVTLEPASAAAPEPEPEPEPAPDEFADDSGGDPFGSDDDDATEAAMRAAELDEMSEEER